MAGLPEVEQKPRFVAAMFGRIAPRYDLMNTLMTAGQDGRWRRVVAASVGRPRTVLDVGTGTGKLAQTIGRAVPGARVIGVDFSEPMLRAGARRSAVADALRLPFADESFDAVTSAFLLRNVSDVEQGVAEQARVLRRGGWLVVLETTPGPRNWLRVLFRLYFRRLVPLLGALIAGDARAYTYLPESTLAFTEPERLAELLAQHGLQAIRVRRLALGSVAVTSGQRAQA